MRDFFKYDVHVYWHFLSLALGKKSSKTIIFFIQIYSMIEDIFIKSIFFWLVLNILLIVDACLNKV